MLKEADAYAFYSRRRENSMNSENNIDMTTSTGKQYLIEFFKI